MLTEGNAIIRITHIGVCGTDLHAFEGTQPYFTYTRILGHELAGELKEVDGAPDFFPGETVTFIPYFNCGKCIACRSDKPNCCVSLKVFGVHIDGGMAEYITVPAAYLVHGEGLPVEALALVEPLSVGAHGVKRANVQPGEWVLVVGAGPQGLGIMEFARIAGGKVIALGINESRLAYCCSRLNISHTVNAHSADVKAQLMEINQGDMPTVVMGATGSQQPINTSFQYLAHGACYVRVGLQSEDIRVSHPEFHKREATLMSSRNATRADFERVIKAMKDNLIDPSIYITHRVGFSEISATFESWLNPANGVIKAMVGINGAD